MQNNPAAGFIYGAVLAKAEEGVTAYLRDRKILN
jgi:hypothetical protein